MSDKQLPVVSSGGSSGRQGVLPLSMQWMFVWFALLYWLSPVDMIPLMPLDDIGVLALVLFGLAPDALRQMQGGEE